MVYKVIFPYLSHLNQDRKFGSPVAVSGKPSKGGILVGGHHYIFTICKHQNNTWEMWGCLRYLDNPAEILERMVQDLQNFAIINYQQYFYVFLIFLISYCWCLFDLPTHRDVGRGFPGTPQKHPKTCHLTQTQQSWRDTNTIDNERIRQVQNVQSNVHDMEGCLQSPRRTRVH